MNKPCLRPIDFQPVRHRGQQMWLLRDPLGLSDTQLIMPAPLAQMLVFLDGEHSQAEIHQAFCRQQGMAVEPDLVSRTLAALDQALLLDNERAHQAQAALLARFRAQAVRPPALSGLSYPAEPEELKAQFARFAAQDRDRVDGWRGRGIISPHIDYARGGNVYARVWRRAQAAVKEAELVLIMGTDHSGGAPVTLTRKPYATPYGLLPTDTRLVDELARAVGPELAFRDELHHRQEHSVELSAVWLHHVLEGSPPPPVIPVLVGSFYRYLQRHEHPRQDRLLDNFIETLRRESAGKKALVVASVDLAHVGPNFGDDFSMDAARRQALVQSDHRLIAAIAAGDADRFYGEIAACGDRQRICGFAPIYLLLRYLGSTSGTPVAYEHCPADPENHSLVSICGMLLS